MAGVRNARAANRERWRNHIEAWRDSVLTHQVYCARQGLKVSSFQRWRRILRGETSETMRPLSPGVSFRYGW